MLKPIPAGSSSAAHEESSAICCCGRAQDAVGRHPRAATPRVVCDVPYVGKRWVHQVARYDTERGISYWTKNYHTAIEADDELALSREYPYYDPDLPAARARPGLVAGPGRPGALRGRHPHPRRPRRRASRRSRSRSRSRFPAPASGSRSPAPLPGSRSPAPLPGSRSRPAPLYRGETRLPPPPNVVKPGFHHPADRDRDGQ